MVSFEQNKMAFSEQLQEGQVTCVSSRFLVILNEVLNNWSGYHITYILRIFMFERLKSYTNTLAPVIKSWAA